MFARVATITLAVVFGVAALVWLLGDADRTVKAIMAAPTDGEKIDTAKRLRRRWQRANGGVAIALALFFGGMVVLSLLRGEPVPWLAACIAAALLVYGVLALVSPAWFGYGVAVDFVTGVDPRGEGHVGDSARKPGSSSRP